MTTPPSSPEVQPTNPKSNRSHTLFWLTSVILLSGIAWLLLWFFYLQYYEYTDDAYVNGNMVNVTPAISGSPIAFYADSTDLVLEGQLLVALDPTQYQIIYDKELAALAATVLQVRQLYDNVAAAKATVENQKVQRDRARYDYDNRSRLVDSKAISNEDFIHSRDSLTTAELSLKLAEEQLKVAIDAAGNTSIEKHPLIEKQKSIVRQAYYNLKHTSVYAATTGYVAQRNVEVGQWVTPETLMMAIIPIDYMWVDANFKETQLTYMRVGQPATVTFDIYGDEEFTGKVLGIASGTGSVFSLIPPQNATGNWIKIVQRLPVRISVDSEKMKKFPLRLGLSAEVNVDLTDQNLPMLVQNPPTKPVATTRVFDLDLKDVNASMDEIVQANLRT